MTKLTDQETSFLRLVLRSPDRGDGWRSVSAVVWRLVDQFPRRELIEAEASPDGGGRVRLSGRGTIVADYL